MNFRSMVILAGLATLAGGCTGIPVEPRQHDDRMYRDDPRIYRETDAYEGYFYVRVIYIDGVPWYVDEYRRVRPIPWHLHGHFQDSSWARSLPPRFGRDRAVRDGYDLSRIVYINDVPHYVDDDRRARPVPDRVRSEFEYRVVVPQQDADRRGDERSQPPQPPDEREARPMPPTFAREREGQEPPAYGRERAHEAMPALGREQERQAPAANGREHAREKSPESGAETMPRRMQAQEPMREESGRKAPPAAGNEHGTPAAQVRKEPPAPGAGRDEGRQLPRDNGRKGDDTQRGESGLPSAGTGKVRGKAQAVIQPARPAGDDRKTRAGVVKGDEQRADPTAEKKGGEARGRGKDRGEEERNDGDDGKEGDGSAKDTRKYRSE